MQALFIGSQCGQKQEVLWEGTSVWCVDGGDEGVFFIKKLKQKASQICSFCRALLRRFTLPCFFAADLLQSRAFSTVFE